MDQELGPMGRRWAGRFDLKERLVIFAGGEGGPCPRWLRLLQPKERGQGPPSPPANLTV